MDQIVTMGWSQLHLDNVLRQQMANVTVNDSELAQEKYVFWILLVDFFKNSNDFKRNNYK